MGRRWPGFDLFVVTPSIFRWPDLNLSSSWGTVTEYIRWPNLDYFSIVDDVMWSLITAVESVALVSMLCFFFVFCGCTI